MLFKIHLRSIPVLSLVFLFASFTEAQVVAHWTGDGSPNDAVGGNNGVFVGSEIYGSGHSGQAFNFDGTNYIVVPDSPSVSPTGQFTIEAWIKPNFNTFQQGIVEKYVTPGTNGFFLRIDSSHLQFGICGATLQPTVASGFTPVTPGIWHHVVAISDSTNVRVYLDGVMDAYTAHGGVTATDGPTTLKIGARGDDANTRFNGAIDDIKIYNVALPLPIPSNHHSVADGDVSGLIAAINLSNATPGPDTIDLAQNGNYVLTYVAGPDSYHGPTGLPIVQGSGPTSRASLTINGNGSTVQRSDAPGTPDFRVFYALYANVILDGVVIKNGAGVVGGGLYLNVSDTIIRNSTITENRGTEGGGITNINASTLTIENSTISYNTGYGGRTGGGLLNFSGGQVTVSNSTFYENRADGSPGFEGRGDAFADAFSIPGWLKIKNSIVASPTRGAGNDCMWFTPVSLGHNIFSDSSCGQNVASGDIVVSNLELSPLADNGGLTPTHALPVGSPARDAIPLSDCRGIDQNVTLRDQRNYARPQFALCDIGAVEDGTGSDFSAVIDFSSSVNPSGAWSYGYTVGANSAFSSFNTVVNNSYFHIIPGMPMDIWKRSNSIQPSVMHNNGYSILRPETIVLPPGILLLHPGPAAERSVVRWTAPESGRYQLRGHFQGLDIACGPTTDAEILQNGSLNLFQTAMNGYGSRRGFDLTVDLAAGETIDFRVGDGGNGFICDSTGLSVNVDRLFVPDSTPPNVVPTVTGTLGNNGWYTSNVSVSWSVTDGESDLSSSSGCDNSTVTSDTGGVTFTCSATSGGGSASNSVTIKRDATAPTINLASPTGNYLLGQVVPASYSCSDGLSGVTTCSGSVANGAAIDTSSAGSRTFTVTATDIAGNNTTSTVVYGVGYGVEVLYDQTKAHKSGSTVPVKIRLMDAFGNNVSSASVGVHAASVLQVSSQASTTLDDSGNSNPDFDFRYDADLVGYIFNLKTTGYSTGTYRLFFTAEASGPYSVGFQVRQ